MLIISFRRRGSTFGTFFGQNNNSSAILKFQHACVNNCLLLLLSSPHSHPELTHLFTSTPKTRYAQRDPYHTSVLMIPDETGQALVSYWCWRYLCVRFTPPSFFSSLICLLLPGLETCMLRTQPVVVHSSRITVNSHLELTHLRVYTPQDSVFPEIDDFHTVLMV